MSSSELLKFFPKSQVEFAEELSTIQKLFLNITPENYNKTYELIYKSNYSKNHENFARSITKFATLRSSLLLILSDLYIRFAEDTNSIDEMKSYLLNKFILNCQKFIICCSIKGFISTSEIADLFKELYEKKKGIEQYIPLISYFAPEINNFYPELIDDFESKIDKCLLENNDLMGYERSFLAGFEHYKEDNWSLLNERRFNTYEPNSLAFIIKNDDLNTFQAVAESDHFHLYQEIPHSAYTETIYPFCNPNIAQFAAFHGALNILYYLIDKEYDLNKPNSEGLTVAQFAVAGGNKNVIKLLKNEGVIFNNTLQAAAMFFRNDLFFELLSEGSQLLDGNENSNIDNVLNSCISQSNMELILFCLSHGCNINQKGNVFLFFIWIIVQFIVQFYIVQMISFLLFFHIKK